MEGGNIVQFDRLRIEGATAMQSAIVWRLIARMIDREFRTNAREVSIIVLKAFPLEYEEGLEGREAAFERRRDAMMRHYARRLGARPFGGEGVDAGWMWININCAHEPRPVAGAARRRG